MVRRTIGLLLLGSLLLILLAVGSLGSDQRGIFAGAGFFGAIFFTLKLFWIVLFPLAFLGALLAFVRDE
jgi:hypothetical protein